MDNENTPNVGEVEESAGKSNIVTEDSLTENKVPNQLPDRKLTLKNGTSISAAAGDTNYDLLSKLLEKEPALFQTMLAIARNPKAEVPIKDVRFLAHAGFLTNRTRTMNEDMRNVILSSYTETPEGPVLLNPFKLETEEEASYLQEIEKQGNVRLRKFLGNTLDDTDHNNQEFTR